MFRNDYILRQIEDMARFLSRLIMGRSAQLYSLAEKAGVPEDIGASTDLLRYRLAMLVNEGGINEAEELLFDELQSGGTLFLELALSFYYTLALMSDEELERSGFEREEIAQGLSDVARLFGVEFDDDITEG